MPAAGCSRRPTPPNGARPTDTLTAAESIARNPWHQPGRIYALLGQFYRRQSSDRRPRINMLAVPYMPYLNWAPSAWVLPLKFDGGGYRAGGKAMFDSEGNLWVGDNFTVGWQGQDSLWQGNATKFAPNGTAALADHHRLHRRRNGGGHVRRRRRRQGQCLVHHLRRQIDRGVRQERQAADAAGGHHVRRPARADAGHHRHAQRRRVGRSGPRRASSSISRRAI